MYRICTCSILYSIVSNQALPPESLQQIGFGACSKSPQSNTQRGGEFEVTVSSAPHRNNSRKVREVGDLGMRAKRDVAAQKRWMMRKMLLMMMMFITITARD